MQNILTTCDQVFKWCFKEARSKGTTYTYLRSQVSNDACERVDTAYGFLKLFDFVNFSPLNCI